MPRDSFSMKVLLKEEVCRSHKQCIRPTEKALCLLKRDSPPKKKKKKGSVGIVTCKVWQQIPLLGYIREFAITHFGL